MNRSRHALFPGLLGVTGAFTLGSIATTIALALIFRFTESAYADVPLVGWLALGGRLMMYAVVFGLTVDAIRFAATFLWPRKSDYAPSLTDLVNIELSRRPKLREGRR